MTGPTAPASFLPFCDALLSQRSPTAGHVHLPLRTPSALSAEIIVSLEDMLGKAATRWLFRDLGWQSRSIIDPADNEQTTSAMIWDHAAWGDMKLQFSADTIDALLVIWNLRVALAKRHPFSPPTTQPPTDQDWADCDWTHNGDLFVRHLLSDPAIHPLNLLPRHDMDPISQMAWFDLAEPRVTDLPRLFEPDVLPVLPWIAASWPKIWRKRRVFRPQKEPQALHNFTAQHSLWDAWIACCRRAHRPDLLAPLVVGYAEQMRDIEQTHTQLMQQLRRTRHVQRHALAATMAAALAPLQELHLAWKEAHSLHPIDRSGSEKLFLTGANAHDLPHLVVKANRFTRTLLGDIG